MPLASIGTVPAGRAARRARSVSHGSTLDEGAARGDEIRQGAVGLNGLHTSFTPTATGEFARDRRRIRVRLLGGRPVGDASGLRRRHLRTAPNPDGRRCRRARDDPGCDGDCVVHFPQRPSLDEQPCPRHRRLPGRGVLRPAHVELSARFTVSAARHGVSRSQGCRHRARYGCSAGQLGSRRPAATDSELSDDRFA